MSRKRRHGVSCRRRSTGSPSASGVGSSFVSAVDVIEDRGSATRADPLGDVSPSVAPGPRIASSTELADSKRLGRPGIATGAWTSFLIRK
jgi:hypothetical protein